MKRLLHTLAGAALVLSAATAQAVTTRTWRVTTYHDFDEGEPSGVLLSSLGDAMSGFSSTRVDIPEGQVQSSAVTADGTVWLGCGGTSDSAPVYTWTPAAGLKKVASLDGVLVVSLAVGPDGAVYAGTLKGGKIWRLEKGAAKELTKLDGADPVWAMAFVGKTLYAATGPNGRVYAVELPSGKSRLFWDSGEKHIMSLVADGKGGLYAGSAEEAILYHVGGDGRPRALEDFEGDEVRAIVRHGDTLFVAVNEFDKTKGGTTTPPANKPHGTKIVVPTATAGTASATVAQAPGRNDRKGKGAIYRVDPDGRVEQLHALGDSYFAALHVDETGAVYAAAGANGRLYLIRPDRTVLTALDLPERQILTLALGGPHPVLGTGDAGALYSVAFTPPKDARYVSKVFDAGFASRWGVARWSATGAVLLETRSGNTARPDKTWSAWQAPARAGGKGEPSEGKIVSPAARYLQFRVAFGKDATVRDVSVYYLPQNQRARVAEITVGDDPGQRLARAARAAGKPRSPVVKVKWRVENPDDDELVYRLYYKQDDELNWKPLGGPEPLTGREYEWNTEAIPDGNYVLKVVASDERANPKEDALDHSLVSTPFLVDNRKPEVQALVIAYPQASGIARDSFSPITELAYSIDGGDFQPFAPRDQIFDEPTEEFALHLPAGLAAGAHSLAVRAVDAADNVGATQLTFKVK